MAGWYLLSKYPKLFAAVTLCCGAGNPAIASIIKDIPLKVFHGGNDNLVDLGDVRNIVNEIIKLGGKASFTEYPSYGHGLMDSLN